MPVSISGTKRTTGVRRKDVAAIARIALAELGLDGAELSIHLTDDAEVRRLNKSYRGRDRPTDVLAFPIAEGSENVPNAPLGDVVISLETALRQAASTERPLQDEVSRLLVHGICHLAGYDHEISRAEANRMARAERRVLRSAASRDPRR